MNKIILVEPLSKEDHVYKHVRMPRLGLPLLGARLKSAGYSVDIYMTTGDALPWPKLLEADLVGISTTTATSREAYRIAGYLRCHNVPVIIGGIHATFMPDEALQHADYVVRGEADAAIIPLVEALRESRPPVDIPGVSYRDGGRTVHNPCSPPDFNLDSLPIPDLSLFHWRKPLRSIPVMTSRGCPYNCVFCSVTPMFGRRYRFRSSESVLRELARYRGKYVFFCDDNFTADKKRSKELLRGMIERRLKLKGWGAQVRVDAVEDEELLELMRAAGAKIVYIGLESINPETLKAYRKQQTVAEVERSIRKFHEYGIRVHGMFVFGGDSDTVQTIRETADFALKARIDSVQFLTLTPLPGTPLFEQLEAEGRLLTREWELYDGHHAVFQPALMSPEQLQDETVRAFKRFYSAAHVFQNVFLTGWGTCVYRAIGWWLIRHFEKKNGWYTKALKQLQYAGEKPVPLLYRLLKGQRDGEPGPAAVEPQLKVYLAENKGVLYLRLRGILNQLNLKELVRTVKKILPAHALHLVINIEGLRFASDKAARGFSRLLNGLGERVRRLPVVIFGEDEQSRKVLLGRRLLKLPRFAVLLNRR